MTRQSRPKARSAYAISIFVYIYVHVMNEYNCYLRPSTAADRDHDVISALSSHHVHAQAEVS